jgi:hypothetical protein
MPFDCEIGRQRGGRRTNEDVPVFYAEFETKASRHALDKTRAAASSSRRIINEWVEAGTSPVTSLILALFFDFYKKRGGMQIFC